ncbi:23S rRNA (adenine(2030)-N(6))-methyltransferase RlmJ [Alteromonas sp. 1_MG-2023]|uniref:23S rRNA (adenine(2030)-N(6))-methyltransferase RlmJ n=1 Tax=Alteromonas sp. 1_MG-2023 TaxID=3062669 RepID=UPI0026E13ED9|nr:23S rRNA (adenine(2030)-N(6))-methyltransferase RlmJ [Alteromonas sp. 1_MG-2023]MDO6565897.1 23S rRNA (adenine(2030)-N(6))-methyltransferase RlmJ [Alteromonas sp. 1_MG-2023]
MLSYQHAFHAGNHADVIKHLCWMGVINHLKKKNKPFTLYDTHSGAGLYQLDDELAAKNKEYESGVDKIATISASSPLLQAYLSLCNEFLSVKQYPGSPAISAKLKREMDVLHLMELHPAEHEKLDDAMWKMGDDQSHVHHRDGFEGLIALTPPVPNRGAVLIDPPYERASEYQDVVKAAKKVLARWQQAQIVVWYPLLSERAGAKSGASQHMCETLSALGKPCFTIEVTVMENTADAGMYGSGLCVINPPWQLDVIMSEALDEITPLLGEQASYNLNWLSSDD